MQLQAGWVCRVKRVSSPHFNERPENETSTLLVIHNISLLPGKFGGSWMDALFTGNFAPEVNLWFAGIAYFRVSAHCLIRRDGEIVQHVSFHLCAWHADVSSYQGREACNDFSIGIEPRYAVLFRCAVPGAGRGPRLLTEHYPQIAEYIAGHSDMVPERKTNPDAALDRARFRGALGQSGCTPEQE